MSACRLVGYTGLLVLLMAAPRAATAGSREPFLGSLAPLPASSVDAATMVGRGHVTAVLEGDRLEISGTFEDLGSLATAARIHRARGGMRGPSVLDLTVPRSASGEFEARIALTPTQIQDLKNGWLYIQIATERHKDGQLRAWLLRADPPR